MNLGHPINEESWKTKPTDRFILAWIKRNLSARITPHLIPYPRVKPWMITLTSACLGMIAGVIFSLGWGWPAGLLAAGSQVLDGVDGQLARLTGRESRAGAFCDSILDRFSDGAMMIGMIIYLVRTSEVLPVWLILVIGSLAFIGSNAVSYSSARAQNLGIQLGKPTLASKGTRSAVMIVCALGSVAWPPLPLAALIYLFIHSNGVLVARLVRSFK